MLLRGSSIVCRLALALSVFVTCNSLHAADDRLPTARSVGAVGDGRADDTDAIQKAIDAGKGGIRFERGVYRLTRTIEVDLKEVGFTSIVGEGNARIVMEGAGPAFRIVGNHQGTADPDQVKPHVWENERMPVISGIEIIGKHAEADGIQLRGTMQANISRVAIREARHGIHLVERNRNVTITASNIYHNTGVGVFVDHCNLHQFIIGDTHISYNEAGGIVVLRGNVRNIHVGNCDIEGNVSNKHPKAANFLVDVTAREGEEATKANSSVAEITIVGCTLQHTSGAKSSANVRILGRPDYTVNNVAITANVLSDVAVSVDLDYVDAVTVSSNQFFVGAPLDVRIRNSNQVTLSGNQYDPRDYEGRRNQKGGVEIEDSSEVILSGEQFSNVLNTDAALAVRNCRNVNVTGCVFNNCVGGVVLQKCKNSLLVNCILAGTEIRASDNDGVQINRNLIAPATDDE